MPTRYDAQAPLGVNADTNVNFGLDASNVQIGGTNLNILYTMTARKAQSGRMRIDVDPL